MFTAAPLDYSDKASFYEELASQARGLLAGETDRVANAANLAALVYHALPGINWAGFYFVAEAGLVVGPFQGKPACVRIPMGKGVCGTAAAQRRTVLVEDVDAFPGHIACDAASRAEIVVPLADAAGELVGVLDIDSPHPGRFDAEDAAGLEKVAAVFTASLGGSGSA